MDDLADGRLYQLRADQQDHRRHGQPRQVFDPVVAEGMSGVSGLRREAEADQRHDGAGGVGEVVDGVRRDGDAFQHRLRGTRGARLCGKGKTLHQVVFLANELHVFSLPLRKQIRSDSFLYL